MANGYAAEGAALSAMQSELLKRIRVTFPLLADISHSSVALYVPERGGFALAALERPRTVYAPADPLAAGRLSDAERDRLLTEAIVSRAEARGEAGCAFPVPGPADGSPIAVVLLCPSEGDLGAAYRGKLPQIAGMLIKQGRRLLPDEQYRHISASDGIIVADGSERILFANTAAQRIYHVLGIGSLAGRRLSDPRLTQYVRRETVERERPWERELLVGNMLLALREIPLAEGPALHWRIVILSDVTELREKEQKIRMQGLLLREVHHRVKNNLQMVASLLRMQARRSGSEETRDALAESIRRVAAVSAVHEMLSRQNGGEIHILELADSLIDLVARGMASPGFALSISSEGEDIVLPSGQADHIALALSELASNAIEHAFAGRTAGRISFTASETREGVVLEMSDDGIGIPEKALSGEGFRTSLGLKIVRGLVEDDLGGSLAIENRFGTHIKILLPREQPKKGGEQPWDGSFGF